jgi:hypothetical protein
MPSTVAAAARIANAGSWSARSAFATGSAFYILVQDTSDAGIEVWKSTNGTTWTQHDSSDEPTNFSATHPYGAYLHSDGYIYVVYFTGATSTIRVIRFDTGTDQWETSTIGGNISTAAVNTANVRVVCRSDNDIIVGYAESTNVRYARWEGSSWTSASVGAATAMHDAVINTATDYIYFTYADTGAADETYRSLEPAANVLGTATDVDTAVSASPVKGSLAHLFSDGTNVQMAWLFRDAGGELDFRHGVSGAATLSSSATVDAVTGTSPQTTAAAVTSFDAGSGLRAHIVWAEANTIKRDVTNQQAPTYTFAGNTTVLSSLTDTDPAPQWINGLSALGILYQDNGEVKVEWVVAPAGGVVDKSGDETLDAVADAATLVAAPAGTEAPDAIADASTLVAQITGAETVDAVVDASSVSAGASKSASDAPDAVADASAVVVAATGAETLDAVADASAVVVATASTDAADAVADASSVDVVEPTVQPTGIVGTTRLELWVGGLRVVGRESDLGVGTDVAPGESEKSGSETVGAVVDASSVVVVATASDAPDAVADAGVLVAAPSSAEAADAVADASTLAVSVVATDAPDAVADASSLESPGLIAKSGSDAPDAVADASSLAIAATGAETLDAVIDASTVTVIVLSAEAPAAVADASSRSILGPIAPGSIAGVVRIRPALAARQSIRPALSGIVEMEPSS